MHSEETWTDRLLRKDFYNEYLCKCLKQDHSVLALKDDGSIAGKT